MKSDLIDSLLDYHYIYDTSTFSLRSLKSFVIFYSNTAIYHLSISSTLPLRKQFSRYFDEKFHCKPGILSNIHTFGADLKLNQHIHCLVTAWGISPDETERVDLTKNRFIDYRYVHSVYKAILVKHVRRFIKNLSLEQQCSSYTMTVKHTISKELYRNSTKKANKSVVVNFCEWVRDVSGTFSYTAKYARKLPISQSRVKGFVNNEVTFQFFDKKEKKNKSITLPAMKFIERLVVHIPDKHFKTTRYAWLFAPNKKQHYLDLIHKLCPIPNPLYEKYKLSLNNFKEKIFSYANKLKCFFWDDPRKCPKCNSSMNITSITIYGRFKTITLPRKKKPP